MHLNRQLGTIQNNDNSNILYHSGGRRVTPEEYCAAVDDLLAGGPSVLAQNVGLPDAVIYRTRVGNTFQKHLGDVLARLEEENPGGDGSVGLSPVHRRGIEALSALFAVDTDPLQLTIDTCRPRGVRVVASYRMNAEDCYHHTWLLSDFARAHPDWRIRRSSQAYTPHPGAADLTGAMDYAVPAVFGHCLALFTEVAREYDIDGIEFDFRRWYHMISNPLENHPVLTDLVRSTRRMLDETAQAKGCDRLLLGVRVSPKLHGRTTREEFPGAFFGEPENLSCENLGLDVKTWIEEERVDYVCPTLFWPRLPGLPNIAEFVDIAQDRNVGIYPTVFPLPAWATEEFTTPPSAAEIEDLMRRNRDEICRAALHAYEDGADGMSTFNWYGHNLFSRETRARGMAKKSFRTHPGFARTQLFVHAFLASSARVRRCLTLKPANEEWSA